LLLVQKPKTLLLLHKHTALLLTLKLMLLLHMHAELSAKLKLLLHKCTALSLVSLILEDAAAADARRSFTDTEAQENCYRCICM